LFIFVICLLHLCACIFSAAQKLVLSFQFLDYLSVETIGTEANQKYSCYDQNTKIGPDYVQTVAF